MPTVEHATQGSDGPEPAVYEAKSSSHTALRFLGAAGLASIALVVTAMMNGFAEWILGSALVVAAALVVDRRARVTLRDLPRGIIVGSCVFVLVLGAARLTIAAIDDHGTLLRPPIQGGSDQIDFTAMAYTFYRHSIPGTSFGREIADPVLAWAEARDLDGNLIERWVQVQGGDPTPRAYAYRPHLYPLTLGTLFKVVGYEPTYGPALNAVLYGLTCSVLLFIGMRWLSVAAAVGAVSLFTTVRLVQVWAFQNMPETLVVLLAALFITAALGMLTATQSTSGAWAITAGVVLGLLVLAKQMFLIAGAIIGIGWLAWCLIRRRDLIKRIVLMGFAAAFLILPWFAYNVATTERADLLTGIGGWHDMPSVYAQEYVDGENRFKIRERLFEEYAAQTGEEVRGHRARALAGRVMFLESLKDGEYWGRIPALLLAKSQEALTGKWSDQLIRVIALIGLIVLVTRPSLILRDYSEIVLVVLVAVAVAPFLVLLLVFPDLGRLMLSTWVPITLLAGAALSIAFRAGGDAADRVERRYQEGRGRTSSLPTDHP